MTAEPCPDCGVMLNRSRNYGRCPECGRVSTLCLAVDNRVITKTCGSCARAACNQAGLVEVCERWTNTDDEETMTFQAYTDGEDTIYGTSPEEAVEVYSKEVGLFPGDMSEPKDFKPLDHSEQQKVTDENTGITETKTIGEWIAFRQHEAKPSRLICTNNW